MAFCNKCGAEIPEGAGFCSACGNALPKRAEENRKESTERESIEKKAKSILTMGILSAIIASVQLTALLFLHFEELFVLDFDRDIIDFICLGLASPLVSAGAIILGAIAGKMFNDINGGIYSGYIGNKLKTGKILAKIGKTAGIVVAILFTVFIIFIFYAFGRHRVE